MGLLRTLLALSVVLSHVGTMSLIGGRNAVQIFYMISGFLISYVITQRASYTSIKDFYISRSLRVFPQYFFVAVLTIIYFLLFNSPQSVEFFCTYRQSDLLVKIWLAIGNISLFTQDWAMFAGERSKILTFEPVLTEAPWPLYKGFLLPQSWTLGVELSFYLIAPFILSRKRLIAALLIGSIILRIFLFRSGLGSVDPWSYRFFPTELALFLIGALSHQFLLPKYAQLQPERYSLPITIAVIAAILAYTLMPGKEIIKSAMLILFIAASLPALFLFQNGRDWDRHIGDLSYPIYINHVTIISILSLTPIAKASNVHAIIAIIISIFMAIAMNYFIGIPIDFVRHRLRNPTSL